jgi:seryl-tRNA synthetase
MIIRYPLSGINDEEKIRQIQQKAYFLSEDVKNALIRGQQLEIEYMGTDQAYFVEKLERLVLSQRKKRTKRPKLIKENQQRLELPAHSFARLADNSGLTLQAESVLLESAFDQLFRNIAIRYAANIRKYPSFLSEEIMKKSGYVKHFPQNVYRVYEIKHNVDSLERFRGQAESGTGGDQFFLPSAYYLQPCVCFHVYDECSRLLDHGIDELQVFSASGKCYRHEHRAKVGPTRCLEFYMNEIVYIGMEKQVKEIRQKIMDEAWDLFAELGFAGKIETATDPFFLETDEGKDFYQLAGELKYELLFSPTAEIQFSLTSFNICGDVLCRDFSIHKEGRPLYSGCTAFGIDRWIQAFLYVHGHEMNKWPNIIKELM